MLEITTVSGTVNSVLYRIPLLDNNNDIHLVRVWQVNKIADGSGKVYFSAVKDIVSTFNNNASP